MSKISKHTTSAPQPEQTIARPLLRPRELVHSAHGHSVEHMLTSTAHVAIAGVVLALSLTTFAVIAYEAYGANAAAEDAASGLSASITQQQMLQRAVRTADTTKVERAALALLPVQQNGGAAFIAAVESLGAAAHTTMTVAGVTASAAPNTSSGAPGSISLSLQFSGSFAQCMQLVRLLETMPGSTALSGLSLSYDPTKGTWSGSVSLSALSYDTQ